MDDIHHHFSRLRTPLNRQAPWVIAAVNSVTTSAAAGALAVEVGGTTGCFIAIAGIPACMGLLILSLYKLLDFED